MTGLNTTELAARLSVSKARISQYVSEGKLNGCFTGDGRSRRFDLAKVADALGKRLDLGQMTGNGLGTRRAIRDIEDGVAPIAPRDGPELSYRDPDRLELATIQIKEEEARRRRRDNERDEGRWVLAAEVQRQSSRAVAREIAQFETVIRDAARAVADNFGVDFREVRKLMMDQWRQHRGQRRDDLRREADAARVTDAEAQANI